MSIEKFPFPRLTMRRSAMALIDIPRKSAGEKIERFLQTSVNVRPTYPFRHARAYSLPVPAECQQTTQNSKWKKFVWKVESWNYFIFAFFEFFPSDCTLERKTQERPEWSEIKKKLSHVHMNENGSTMCERPISYSTKLRKHFSEERSDCLLLCFVLFSISLCSVMQFHVMWQKVEREELEELLAKLSLLLTSH